MKTSERILYKRSVRFTLGVAVFAASIAYAGMIISASGRGYELKDLSVRQTALQEETRRIETGIAGEVSLNRLKERSEALGLTQNAPVEYVRSPNDSVALR